MGKCSNPQTNPAINPGFQPLRIANIVNGICPKEIEKLLPKSKGISDSTIASAAIIVPSIQIFVPFPTKNSSFRIITIHKGEVLDSSTRHNSYVRMIETGTKGLEYSHSQPFQTPL